MLRRLGAGARFAAAGLLLALAPAGAQTPPPPGRIPGTVAGCPVCDLWNTNREVFLQAGQEVGSLQNGVVYYYHSDNPTVIEGLRRFAYERDRLSTRIRKDPDLQARMRMNNDYHGKLADGTVQVVISKECAHGFFAIVTSDDPAMATLLHEQASRAVRGDLIPY